LGISLLIFLFLVVFFSACLYHWVFARLAGNFHGLHEVQESGSGMMDPASLGMSQTATNNKAISDSRISSQFGSGSVW
jgi:hypothetical protein